VVSSHDEKEEVIFQAYKDRVGTSDNRDMLFDLSSVIHATPGLEELSAPFTKRPV
jgi:hypothetical protein